MLVAGVRAVPAAGVRVAMAAVRVLGLRLRVRGQVSLTAARAAFPLVSSSTNQHTSTQVGMDLKFKLSRLRILSLVACVTNPFGCPHIRNAVGFFPGIAKTDLNAKLANMSSQIRITKVVCGAAIRSTISRSARIARSCTRIGLLIS